MLFSDAVTSYDAVRDGVEAVTLDSEIPDHLARGSSATTIRNDAETSSHHHIGPSYLFWVSTSQDAWMIHSKKF